MAAAGYSWMLAAALSVLLLKSATNAQQTINTPCSSSMISSFTPCMNFMTGSSGGAATPSQDCCDALKALTLNNMDCACLIITGSVPVSMPFVNINVGFTLPRACKSNVPLQCKASGVPLPAPGPVLFAPPPPPAPAPHVHAIAPSPHIHATAPTPISIPVINASAPAPVAQAHTQSPKGSKAVAVAAPAPAETFDDADDAPEPSPPADIPLGPSANPGIRPVMNHNSSASNLVVVSLSYLVVMFGGIIAFKFF